MVPKKATAVINAVVLRPGQPPREGGVLFRGEKIERILPKGSHPSSPAVSVIDAKGDYLIPGFIDLHVHGGGGFHFTDDSGVELPAILKTLARFGTTSLLPTIATSSQKQLLRIVRVVKKAMADKKSGASILGLNLEGPYLSIGKRGAQPLRFLSYPDLQAAEAVLAAAGGSIRIMTLAPELEGSLELIRLLRRSGVIPAIGHTSADYEVTKKAIDAGLVYATHVFNSYPLLHHREPGAVGAVLESDRLHVEVLCDGIHLSPVIIRLLFRLKELEKLLLVTDGTPVIGGRKRRFFMGGREVKVDSQGARLDDGTLVGSMVPMNHALRNVVRFTGLPLSRVLALATLNPARLLGVEDRKGDLGEGMDADLVVMDKKFTVKRTIVAGRTVYLKR